MIIICIVTTNNEKKKFPKFHFKISQNLNIKRFSIRLILKFIYPTKLQSVKNGHSE
jgi:hypothetical protein